MKETFDTSVIEELPHGVIAFDNSSRVRLINRSAQEFFGVNKCDQITDLASFFQFAQALPELLKILEENTKKEKSFDLVNITYENFYLNIQARFFKEGFILTFSDNTSVKETELKALHTLLKVLEKEKKRLATEIHDGIGPTLSAVKLNLQIVQSELQVIEAGTVKRLEDTYKLIDDLSDDMRSISHALLPKVLIDFGLIAAMENLCERVEEVSKVKVEFIGPTSLSKKVDYNMELNLYRIAQELFNNTLKYAEAGKVTVKLSTEDSSLEMIYTDDGKGFDVQAPSHGIGLLNMKTRVRAMKGKFIINSGPGKGVKAEITVPTKRE